MSTGSSPGGRGGVREGGRVNSAVRGAGLIGLAVILGIVLLQVIDKGPSGSGTSASERRATATTQAAAPGTSQPATTTAGVRPRAEVRVGVFNGSGVSGAAMNMTNKLRPLGYQLGQPADSASRTGTVVACKEGFEKEAAQLQGDVGQGTGVEPFPGSPPAGTENVNCIVLLGR
jgi:LytR cell envelope-related transcriptional attenuator